MHVLIAAARAAGKRKKWIRHALALRALEPATADEWKAILAEIDGARAFKQCLTEWKEAGMSRGQMRSMCRKLGWPIPLQLREDYPKGMEEPD